MVKKVIRKPKSIPRMILKEDKSPIEDKKKKSDKEIRLENIIKIKEKQLKNPFKIHHNKPGSPTKYEPKYAREMLEYFKKHIDGGYYEDYIEETLNAFGQPVDQIKKRAKPIPMFEKYALSIGIDSHSLLNWAIKKDKDGKLEYKEFFSSYKQCLDIQLCMLKELGMNGQYVSNIVKLLLSAEHGIYEVKEENDNTDKGKKIADINSTNIDDNLQDILN